MLIADRGGTKAPPYEFARTRRLLARNRGSRAIPHLAPRAKSPLRACEKPIVGANLPMAFPNEGCPRLRRARRYAALRQSREGGPSKTVDEDVGSRFVGKRFEVHLRAGVHHP